MKLAQLIAALPQSGNAAGQAGRVAPQDAATVDRCDIRALFYRSQDVTPGGLFVAVKGFAADGHDFIEQAIARGAAAVVCEKPCSAAGAVMIPVADSRKALAALAAEFYGHPSRHMTVIGITGTNGKTTTSYLIESILQAAGHATGVIGTINYRFGGKCFDTPVTTPESLDLQRILADMRSAGVTHAVMEISSHALDLCRVHACNIDVAVFTNLTQDHLDFHQTMEAYWASKRKLFELYLPASAGKHAIRAVLNTDDPRGNELAAALKIRHLTAGQQADRDIRAIETRFDLIGITARVQTPGGELTLHSALVGRHNLENILGAVGVGIALNIPPAAIVEGIRALPHVPGRLERVLDPSGKRFVYVDYAHTPDALEKALLALQAVGAGRMICVFGCGGDRDRGKRSLMGAIAARLSHLAVVTSDNPRTEAPETIIAQILAGMNGAGRRIQAVAELGPAPDAKAYLVEADRRNAIRLSISAARAGDTILIAGKGHETYQIIGRTKYPFDDRSEARQALASMME